MTVAGIVLCILAGHFGLRGETVVRGSLGDDRCRDKMGRICGWLRFSLWEEEQFCVTEDQTGGKLLEPSRGGNAAMVLEAELFSGGSRGSEDTKICTGEQCA